MRQSLVSSLGRLILLSKYCIDNRDTVQWGTQDQLTPPTRAAQRGKASSRIKEMSNPKTFYYPFGYEEKG